MRLELRIRSMIAGPSPRPLRRTVGIAYMARHASWRVRQHRRLEAELWRPVEPDNPARAAVYYQPQVEAPQDWSA